MKKSIFLSVFILFSTTKIYTQHSVCMTVSGSNLAGTVTITYTNSSGASIRLLDFNASLSASPAVTFIDDPDDDVGLNGSTWGIAPDANIVNNNARSFSVSYTSLNNNTKIFTMSNPSITISSGGIISTPNINIPSGCSSVTIIAGLPVELLTLTATPLSKTTKIEWLTASEKNSSHFEIERSSDAKVFDKIGIIRANGNTYSKQDYEFLDEKPFQGINYYRLKMVDLDATYEYSKIVSVWMDKKGKDKIFTIAPNPARGNVNFNIFNGEESEAILDVRDIAGREIYHKKLNKADNIQKIDWNTEGVSKGVYFVTLTADGERITKKLILN